MQFIRAHIRTLVKVYLLILFLFLLQILLSYLYMYQASIQEMRTQLSNLGTRIQNDLKYQNGKWDTQLYNADPLTPYPNGSSGFSHPLYIVTQEGFVIERSQPIKGFLDTSDVTQLLRFQNPSTIDTITNEKWRIISTPIEYGGKIQGVIAVSYYNPRVEDLQAIDQNLVANMMLIKSHIEVGTNGISVQNVDIRHIHYEFSFEVVDRFNNVLINNGRVPTFIDVSYFSREITGQQQKIVYSSNIREEFLVIEKVVRDAEGNPVGLIILGDSVRSMFVMLRQYLVFSLLVGLCLGIPLLTYTVVIVRKEILPLFAIHPHLTTQIRIHSIWFDRQKSMVYINDKAYSIPYASNQYYICDSILTAPTKRWEYDQLLAKLGDTTDEINTRKVYDAVLAINKKCGIKLIVYKDKVFSFNPTFLSSLIQKK